MEVVGAASAIAGLISLSGGILAKGYTFLSSVHRAPQELRELLCEAAALNSVLNQLQSLTDEERSARNEKDVDNKTRRPGLEHLADAGVLQECSESLMLVDRSIKKCQQIQGQELRNFGKRIIWPFKEKETKEALARLARIRGHLTAALTADMATNLSSIDRVTHETAVGVAGLQERTAKRDRAEEHLALLSWLDPHSINVEENLKEGLKNRHPGTGEWLFESECYESWEAGPSSVLWIHGIAGSGKTVLASSVIERLLRHDFDSCTGIVHFYCDHRDANKRTLQNFLAAAIVQLLKQEPALEEEAATAFRRYCDHRLEKPKPISLNDQLSLLTTMTQRFSAINIVIDALDECKDVEEFVHQGLEQLINVKGELTVRILCTGRNNYSLERTIGVLASDNIALEQNVTEDIEAYVTDQVECRSKARKLKVRSAELKDQIVHELSHHSGGMFIWVTLQLDLFSRLTTDKAIRDALHKLPHGLNNTYFQLLEQVRDRNADHIGVITKTLKWIVSSLVPLTLAQLAEATSIDRGDTHRVVDKMINDEKDLLEMLGSLVIFDPAREDPFVSLAHFTLYEFFQSDELRTHHSLSPFYIPPQAIMEIGITCAQYLSFTDFGQPCGSIDELHERLESYKLLDFAATNFLVHLQSYGGRGPAIKDHLASFQWFLDPCRDGQQNFISWQQVYKCGLLDDSLTELLVPDPLTYIIENNMLHLIDVFLLHAGEKCYEAVMQSGFTPLHIAVITGDEGHLAGVLRSGPNLEASVNRGQTALHLAASYGHVGMIKLLLEAGASPHARTESGSTPAYPAARNGSVAALQLLADAGSDLDATTWDGWTPVFEAIESHHVCAVEWLVRKGVNLGQTLMHGTTVLEFASASGDQAIIEIVEKGL